MKELIGKQVTGLRISSGEYELLFETNDKLTTNKGYADVVFRNSSNGYYGGWLKLGVGAPPSDMRTIADDWHA